jgi:glycyl-tRNA synthetase (class II)
MNVMLAAAAMNFKRVMNLSKQRCVQFILNILKVFRNEIIISFLKTTF